MGFGEKLFASSEERHFAEAIEEGLDGVERALAVDLQIADPIADVTGRYLLNAGGKRVRPALTLLTAHLGEGINDSVVTAAEAIEITHLASLYHDDVMDGATMRRGVPSVQTVWGNSVAILTGDLLFARAGKLIASLGPRATELQAEVFERLCLGQLHETVGPQEGDDPIEHYIQVLADKTGSLISAAAEVGVVFSNAPEQYRAPVVSFGEKIGVAFQLIDDVIDLSAEFEQTGKVAGTDLRAGVATLPLLYLRRQAETDAAAADLLARIESDAVEAIAPLPDVPVKKALTRFAETIVERSK
jgi:heptaprenyl diphosphate synthase